MFRSLVFRRQIEKLMVANRGEIARRVFRTCRELNIKTVALFSDVEGDAQHVVEADEAVCIGSPPVSASYLRGDAIVEFARQLNVDAIHPGYGFLSENESFARAVGAAGMEFIGPPASAIASMGSKSESKRIMEEAGVPVVPGYYGENQSLEHLTAEAEKIQFPVLIKAVSGGGGKGMKIVERREDFQHYLESAKREAVSFFKDDRVIIEKYISRPRHIECQIVCDKHGNGVFFFERDCSVQRRYQKVLEEAPAPHISEEVRRSIGDVALKAAKAVGYVGAGTVEFIFDTDTNTFYFMEMNTRLQVEHPVTEEVCRIKGEPLDLVKLQLHAAMGRPFDFTQDDISLVGSCIEARIYAESPEQGFLPGSGPLRYMKEPPLGTIGGCKYRLDSGFREGDEVQIHFDPMISKLIVWGENREEALKGMKRALNNYHVAGIDTNIEFLKRCCDSPAFQQGGVTTNFIAENEASLLTPREVSVEAAVLAALSTQWRHSISSPSGAFRLNGTHEVSVPLHSGTTPVSVVLRSTHEPRCVEYRVGEKTGTVSWSEPQRTGAGGDILNVVATFDQCRRVPAHIALGSTEVSVVANNRVERLQLRLLPDGFGDSSAQPGASARMVSPMPGKISKLLVKNGDRVAKGDRIMILEAMKMEHPIKATQDGVVTFAVQEGEVVGGDHLLGSVADPEA